MQNAKKEHHSITIFEQANQIKGLKKMIHSLQKTILRLETKEQSKKLK